MKIFIGCSSKNDIPKKYYDDCKILLDLLLKNNDLVFGAFYGGLMGLAYDIALTNNSKVIGICPEVYKHDFKNLKCTSEIIATSINDRTEKVINESDILLFIPGGIGTIYELYVALECKRCHEFDKPIIIYNSNGFYDKLLEFMEVIFNEKFANISDKNIYFVSDNKDNILNFINKHKKVK